MSEGEEELLVSNISVSELSSSSYTRRVLTSLLGRTLNISTFFKEGSNSPAFVALLFHSDVHGLDCTALVWRRGVAGTGTEITG